MEFLLEFERFSPSGDCYASKSAIGHADGYL